jgi:DNA repair protein RadD
VLREYLNYKHKNREPKMIEPRYYQIDCLNAIFKYFENGGRGNPICAVGTGLGKSVIISMFLMKAFYLYSNQKVLVLTHVKELIDQNAKELLGMWHTAPIGINSSSLNQRDIDKKIIFAGIQSIYKNAAAFGKIDLIIIDECHLISDNDETMYRMFIDFLLTINPRLKVIGFTATPWRQGLGLLTEGNLFTDFCYDITDMQSFNKMITEGYLCPLIPKKTNYQLDLSGVKLGQDGDFAKGQLQLAVDKHSITLAALKETCELAYDRNCWLIFASGIEHCEHIVEILEELDVSATCIHSKIKIQERDERFRLFKTGKIKALVGFRVMTTGFNHPPIDTIIDLYPTTSSSMHVQKYGRGTRPYDWLDPQQYKAGFDYTKENTLVLDFAGNTARLGPINDPVIPKKKGQGKAGSAPVRLCQVCNCYNHATARICIYCGAEFTMQVKINDSAGTLELIKQDIPEFQEFKIDQMTYAKHTKQGGKTSLKVTYYCGLRHFTEYVGIEHTGYPKNKANDWWQARTGFSSPDSVLAALYLVDSLRTPSHIRVWINKKYPEIVDHIFTNTVVPIIKDISNEDEIDFVPYDDSIPFDTLKVSNYIDDQEVPF